MTRLNDLQKALDEVEAVIWAVCEPNSLGREKMGDLRKLFTNFKAEFSGKIVSTHELLSLYPTQSVNRSDMTEEQKQNAVVLIQIFKRNEFTRSWKQLEQEYHQVTLDSKNERLYTDTKAAAIIAVQWFSNLLSGKIMVDPKQLSDFNQYLQDVDQSTRDLRVMSVVGSIREHFLKVFGETFSEKGSLEGKFSEGEQK